jgi:hypothetical protein
MALDFAAADSCAAHAASSGVLAGFSSTTRENSLRGTGLSTGN